MKLDLSSIFSKIVGLLPTLIQAVEKVAVDLEGGQKKQIVTDILNSTAAAVASTSPENAGMATAAAAVAVEAIDGVVAIIKGAQSTTAPNPTPAP